MDESIYLAQFAGDEPPDPPKVAELKSWVKFQQKETDEADDRRYKVEWALQKLLKVKSWSSEWGTHCLYCKASSSEFVDDLVHDPDCAITQAIITLARIGQGFRGEIDERPAECLDEGIPISTEVSFWALPEWRWWTLYLYSGRKQGRGNTIYVLDGVVHSTPGEEDWMKVTLWRGSEVPIAYVPVSIVKEMRALWVEYNQDRGSFIDEI